MTLVYARPLESDHLETRVSWFNNPSVYRHMVIDAPISLAATQHWFARTLLNDARKDFVFSMADNDGAIAMGGLTDIDHRNRRAELYIVVNPTMAGKGLGQVCTQWLCNYGFVSLALNRVYLFTTFNNERAKGMYTKLGFSLEGLMRKHVFQNGAFVDRYVLSLLREEWDKLPWRVNKELYYEMDI